MDPITYIRTPFKQKFGIPRQPLLVPEARGVMIFKKDSFYSEAFRGIQNFSHLWLLFKFHSFKEEKVSALVQPPRFDGDEKFGVFATRSPFRINSIGLSAVEFDRIQFNEGTIELHVKGVDMLDGTPIFDIKPYIPYCDSIANAQAGVFSEKPALKKVNWLCEPQLSIEEKKLIESIIAMDPRPGHYKFLDRDHAVLLANYNVKFRLVNDEFLIFEVENIHSSHELK